MSGFFSMVGKDHQEQGSTTNGLFLFKNEEVYNKGFELWQQYYQLHQQTVQAQLQDLMDHSTEGSSRRFLIAYGSNCGDQSSYRSSGFNVMSSGGTRSGGSINCQDCGNQAKKDCPHLRCRTCCKSRGFQCQTHVKSTWVPAAKRRERQQQLAALQQQQQNQQQELSVINAENPKRQRENKNKGFELEVARSDSFPAEVNSPAVFRCVRVSAMDDAEEQYAYQAAVNIGGRVFKGILYDQGLENHYAASNSSPPCGGVGVQQPLNLISATAAASTTGNNAAVSMIDPSLGQAAISVFMAGTQFFPPAAA